MRVFDELLRDGGCALTEGKARKIAPACCQHTLVIDAVMPVKPLVLDGDERIFDVFRDLG